MQNILVDQCLYETGNPTEEYHDLVFFRVERTWLKHSADRPFFFPVEAFSSESRTVSFFYGYPLSRSEFQYEPLHAFLRIAYIDGRLDEGYQSCANYMRRYVYTKSDYEVNGFSGGAVFSLIGNMDDGWKVGLDGIIVRGGSGYLYVVDADYLMRAFATF